MAKYKKGNGHHCWWLKKDGKAIANFDNEADVDEIIEMKNCLVKIKDDLDMRAEIDDGGCRVVNLSNSIYQKLNELTQ